MPYYYFEQPEGEEITLFMTISEYDQYVIDNPTHKQLIKGAPSQGDPFRRKKPDGVFRERLQEIQKAHKKGTINTF